MELVDKSDIAIPQLAFGRLGPAVHRLTVDEHLAFVGLIQAAHDLQQCCLARARRTDNGHPLRRLHRQIDATQHLQASSHLR